MSLSKDKQDWYSQNYLRAPYDHYLAGLPNYKGGQGMYYKNIRDS
jgi:hypothetical protein